MYIKDWYRMGSSPTMSSCLPKILATGLYVAFKHFVVKKQPALRNLIHYFLFAIS